MRKSRAFIIAVIVTTVLHYCLEGKLRITGKARIYGIL